VLARLDEVLSSKPAKIFIMIGINDIAKETTDSVIISNYKKIIKQIQLSSQKTKIIVQSILPTNNDFVEFKRHQNKTEHIQNINSVLKEICIKQQITYVDLYNAFIDEQGKLNKMYTNDGLHINGFGYMKWKELLLQLKLMK
jgi:lysophospholipase L1-like esterase